MPAALLKSIIENNLPLIESFVDDRNPSQHGSYKFLKDYNKHIDRAYSYLKIIQPNPTDKIFEIAPGPSYLLWFLKNHGCNIRAIDADIINKTEKVRYYQEIRRILKLDQCVILKEIQEFTPIEFNGKYDWIISTYFGIGKSWSIDGHKSFITDCYNHLKREGKMFFDICDPFLASIYQGLPRCHVMCNTSKQIDQAIPAL